MWHEKAELLLLLLQRNGSERLHLCGGAKNGWRRT